MNLTDNQRRTPPGVRELKPLPALSLSIRLRCRTPPGVRELKLMFPILWAHNVCRTPPGVRELKRLMNISTLCLMYRRTPPGVRELKRAVYVALLTTKVVAPLPGCVN